MAGPMSITTGGSRACGKASTFPKRGDAYIQKVNEYNALVNQHEELKDELNSKVSTYNGQVKSFNNCIAGI